jgi:porphobilinogen synthase
VSRRELAQKSAMTEFPQSFPATRMRRLRQAPWVRSLTAENVLTPADLVWAVFVHDGEGRVPVASLPGVDRLNVDEAAKAAVRARELGIPAIAIFPHINAAKKNEGGDEAVNPDGLIPTVIQAMKAAAPEVGIACDVALDPFTSHGHDGLLNDEGYVLNDETVAVLHRTGSDPGPRRRRHRRSLRHDGRPHRRHPRRLLDIEGFENT